MPSTTLETLGRSRFSALLLALVALMVTTPLVELAGGLHWAVLDVLFTAMMLALLYAIASEPHFPAFAIVVGLPALVTRWAVHFVESPVLVFFGFALQIAFLGISMVVVLLEILRSVRVSTDTVFGGISVYLLIGMTFALVYGLIEFLDPAAFTFRHAYDGIEPRLPGSRGFAELLYFSFVTQTTLGYGDLLPVAPEARSMSSLQAVTGQIYLAVFVARLVGLHMAHAAGDPEI